MLHIFSGCIDAVEFISATLLLACFLSVSVLSPCSFFTALFSVKLSNRPFSFLLNAIFLEKRYFGDVDTFPYHSLCSSVLSRFSQDCVDCSPPGSSVRGISPARTLERAAISSSSGSSKMGVLTANSLSVS